MFQHQHYSEPDHGAARDEGPGRLLELAFAFRPARVLMSAVEFGVFTALSEGPLGCEALMSRVNVHRRGAKTFLDTLVAHGLLHRDQEGRYRNSVDSDRYLSRRSPDYLGDLVEHVDARMYEIWGRLSAALCSGLPQSGALGAGGYDALYAGPAALDRFLRAMSAGSRMPAKALARLVGWDRYASFVDIGAAQGCAAAEIAKAHPHLSGIGFDLAVVGETFLNHVNASGLGERLRFCSGDFFQDELPGADVLIMGRILHNWGLPTKRMLLEKAHRALPVGGALIVYEPMIDEDRENTHALLASLTMLLETQEGFEMTPDECRRLMSKSRFARMHAMKLDAGHTAVIGYKEP